MIVTQMGGSSLPSQPTAPARSFCLSQKPLFLFTGLVKTRARSDKLRSPLTLKTTQEPQKSHKIALARREVMANSCSIV